MRIDALSGVSYVITNPGEDTEISVHSIHLLLDRLLTLGLTLGSVAIIIVQVLDARGTKDTTILELVGAFVPILGRVPLDLPCISCTVL